MSAEMHVLEQKIKELEQVTRELDTIIESSYDVIYITDGEGMTLQTNSAIERISGIPKDYFIGKNVRELIDRGILRESVTLKVVEQGKPVTVVQKNFEGKETLMTGSPIFNKSGEIEKVVTNIRDLSELNRLHDELKKAQKLNDHYKKELEQLKTRARPDPEVIIASESLHELYDVAERIAHVDATVLILGETGVGKDILARHIYRTSHRFEQGKFIKINCGAIPKELLESELFGYEGGAFTGANRTGKPGMFELADQGVLFLDEIGELPLSLQVKLLRVLQEKEIQRVGATTTKEVDVRVLAATNRNLKEMVGKGEFREDLYYRLHVIPLFIPPLRERRDDILPLLQNFIIKSNQTYNLSKEFDQELREFFFYYNWPGNVRELTNLVERLILTIPKEVITASDLPQEYRDKEKGYHSSIEYKSAQELGSLQQAREMAERELLEQAVTRCNSTYQIARELKSSQATIVRKLKKYNLTI
jgi:PAS domain S-box-containing protein